MAICVALNRTNTPFQLPALLGLGSLLREKGREQEGMALLQEASGIVSAPVVGPCCGVKCLS